MLIKSNTNVTLDLSEQEAKQLCTEIENLMKFNSSNIKDMTMLSTLKNAIILEFN